jgi:hypothetical protein
MTSGPTGAWTPEMEDKYGPRPICLYQKDSFACDRPAYGLDEKTGRVHLSYCCHSHSVYKLIPPNECAETACRNLCAKPYTNPNPTARVVTLRDWQHSITKGSVYYQFCSLNCALAFDPNYPYDEDGNIRRP